MLPEDITQPSMENTFSRERQQRWLVTRRWGTWTEERRMVGRKDMDGRCCQLEPRGPISRTKSQRGVCSTVRVVSCRDEKREAAEARLLQQLWGRRLLPGGCAFSLPNPPQPSWSLGLVCQEPRDARLGCQLPRAPKGGLSCLCAISHDTGSQQANTSPEGVRDSFWSKSGVGKGSTPGASSLTWCFPPDLLCSQSSLSADTSPHQQLPKTCIFSGRGMFLAQLASNFCSTRHFHVPEGTEFAASHPPARTP